MPARWTMTICVAGLIAAAPAAAQAPSPDPCAAGRATIGSDREITTPNTKKGEPLSQHLAQSGGVICPPAGVDPDIKLPTPQGGRMPVIPPPGSPGSNPDVHPK